MVGKKSRALRTVYVCQACGQHSPKWLGRCPGCAEWSTLVEEVVQPDRGATSGLPTSGAKAQRLVDVAGSDSARFSTGIAELDRVLGGGLVRGAFVLVGGDPGIGKSTLLLQAAAQLAARDLTVLYVTAEESPSQVKLRAERLGVISENLYLLAVTDLEVALTVQKELRPQVMVVDSVQTVGLGSLDGAMGSVGQIRAVSQRLMEVAKGEDVAIFVVGHVTKEGTIAGPKVMEHMVDTVLYFEGERTGPYRILRAHKNRFGSAQEIGVFEMVATGLQAVGNPSALFLAQRAVGPGATVVTSLEGSRPILLEVQALVTPAFFGGTPRRTTTGFDPHRVAMLCAVLGARAGVDLSGADVFVNVAGGVRLGEPAADLGVLLALASAATHVPIATDCVVIGEVGLSGEVRVVSQLEARLAEAAGLGFTRAVIPAMTDNSIKYPADMIVRGVPHVGEALNLLKIPAHKMRPRKAPQEATD